MKELKKKLIELSNLDGISGHEEEIISYVKNELKDLKGLKFERDGLGSMAVIKKSKKANAKKISFVTHIDEVGFIVKKIEENGYIRFLPIGGWWGHVLLGQLLKIKTDKNDDFIGVVGSKPPHLLNAQEAKSVLQIKSMFLDIGATSKKEVEKLGISIGNQIVPYQNSAIEILNDRIIGKAHDNRASVLVGMEIMRKLNNKDLDNEVIFVLSTQEEVGLRGARTSTYKWTPDVAFAIDVTIANDTPEIESNDTKLGSGAALSVFDSSIIANPKLLKKVQEIAKKHKIKYTFDSIVGGGTDAGAIHLTKDGVITMTISIPSRYIHSHNSIVDIKDLETTIELVEKFILDFNDKVFEEISYK